jgi:putative transposase
MTGYLARYPLAACHASPAGSPPGFPHQVTHRGNRRAPIVFKDGDDVLCRALPAERCRKASVACWAYCLMPNHVHLILVPATADGLARVIGET